MTGTTELLSIIRELVDAFKPSCPDDYKDGLCALRVAESVLSAKGPPMTDQQTTDSERTREYREGVAWLLLVLFVVIEAGLIAWIVNGLPD